MCNSRDITDLTPNPPRSGIAIPNLNFNRILDAAGLECVFAIISHLRTSFSLQSIHIVLQVGADLPIILRSRIIPAKPNNTAATTLNHATTMSASE